MNVKCVMPSMTNDIAVILLNMFMFEKGKHCIFKVPCFICIYFLGYQIGLKSVFF